jgi:hypothetical protein
MPKRTRRSQVFNLSLIASHTIKRNLVLGEPDKLVPWDSGAMNTPFLPSPLYKEVL